MAFTLDLSLALGNGKAGLTDLRAQLVDTAGSSVGSAVTTGFTEIGQGNYLWHYAAFPTGHRGGVKFYSAADASTILAFTAINPEEAENVDAKVTTIPLAMLTATVDGITLTKLLEVLLAAVTGVAVPSGSTVAFKRRDGTSTSLTITYGSIDGERTVSTIAP